MAKAVKKKRGVGRPARMDKLLFDMQAAVLKGQEDLAVAYPTAVKYLIETLSDSKASVTNKISAAKTIKECVEASLNEMELEDEEGDSQDTPEEGSEGPRLVIG